MNTINSISVLARPVHIAIMIGGRGGQPSKFILVAALSAHILKVLQIYRQLSGEEKADNEDDLIASYTPLRAPNQSSTNERIGKSYELTASQ